MKSQSAGEQYSLQSAEYNGSRSVFYNISTIFLFPVFSSLFVTNKGILFVLRTFCLQRDLPLLGELQRQKCGSFFWFWGV